MIKDIAFTAYPAKDVAALRKFYADALSLQFSGDYEQDGTLVYTEAEVGSGWFSVMTSQWVEDAPAGGVAFEVDDIEKTAEALRAKDVHIENIYDTPVCRLTSFRDPEGNKVTLHQTTVAH